MSKPTMFVNVYDDRIETVNEEGLLAVSDWVTDAGINPDYLYPCCMVEVLFEIQHMQDLGFDVMICDKREDH